jgi:hypothetical protein
MARKRLKVIAGAMLVIVGLAVGVGIWGNSPARTSSSISTAETTVLGSETGTTKLSTSYMDIVVPDNLRLKTSTENQFGSIVGQYLISGKSFRDSDQVGITVGKLDNAQIDQISPVQFRSRDPVTYQPSSLANTPAGALVFVAPNGYEKSVFWTHGDLYAAVVVSGSPGQVTSLDEVLSVIINSWQWH